MIKSKSQNTLFNRVKGAATSTSALPTSKNVGSAFSKLSGLMRGTTTGLTMPALESPIEDDKREGAGQEDLSDAIDDGNLSLEIASKMLGWHGEAIGRCVNMSSTTEL